MKKEMIQCNCGSEALVLEYDDGLVYLSIWERGFPKRPFWNKVRMIWRIIRRGTPYGDQMVLSADECLELERALLKYRKAMKKEQRNDV